mmetsp:Transcript_111761/g.193953  ORF Transcript_111761/g.193953 Transcript_111761/m.193953 type:complete len:213 (-) Transcript_111761:736-1374(-)
MAWCSRLASGVPFRGSSPCTSSSSPKNADAWRPSRGDLKQLPPRNVPCRPAALNVDSWRLGIPSVSAKGSSSLSNRFGGGSQAKASPSNCRRWAVCAADPQASGSSWNMVRHSRARPASDDRCRRRFRRFGGSAMCTASVWVSTHCTSFGGAGASGSGSAGPVSGDAGPRGGGNGFACPRFGDGGSTSSSRAASAASAGVATSSSSMRLTSS